MEGIYERALALHKEKSRLKRDVNDKLNYTEQQLLLITQEMKEKIHHMVEDVEQRVSVSLRAPIYHDIPFNINEIDL